VKLSSGGLRLNGLKSESHARNGRILEFIFDTGKNIISTIKIVSASTRYHRNIFR